MKMENMKVFKGDLDEMPAHHKEELLTELIKVTTLQDQMINSAVDMHAMIKRDFGTPKKVEKMFKMHKRAAKIVHEMLPFGYSLQQVDSPEEMDEVLRDLVKKQRGDKECH